jgi:hypothetical protein
LNTVALRSHKHAVLLVLLLVVLALQSFQAGSSGEGLVSDVFRTVLSIATFVVVFERPRERAVMGAILVLIIVLAWTRRFSAASLDYALSLALHALISLFLWAAVWVILRDLFGKPPIGAENVLGAICGYIIAGDAWAHINAITYLLMPAAYSVNPEVSALLADWHGRLALFSYYSISAMLTLGYSDVTPVRAPATTLSLLGALFGLFYTAVVVSQLVGLAQSKKGETP